MKNDLSFFFKPKGVAVIGASNRGGSWGNRIVRGLVMSGYPGPVYLVNPNSDQVLGLPVYPSLVDIPGEVDLAVIAIPAEMLWKALEGCALKGVKGVVVITAGFGEVRREDKAIEEKMALFGRKNNIRILGPNVSGIYNLHDRFFAAGEDPSRVIPTKMSFICQGGFAVHSIVDYAFSRGIGIGKFVQTGNEADLQSIDFLECLGDDPETEVILMYVEGLKDPRRFLKIAGRITSNKPIIICKGGQSLAGNRAATSHTGVMAGSFDLYQGLFRQARCIMATSFETILDLGRALTYYPPLRGNRIGIVTQGGSWGVMLTDQLSLNGFVVSEFSGALQDKIRDLGLPDRASSKNPVDFGAAVGVLNVQRRIQIIETLMSSLELDAVLIHGYGQVGMRSETLNSWVTHWQEGEEEVLKGGVEVMRKYHKPFLIGSHASPFENTTIKNLIRNGIPTYERLGDLIDILRAMRSDAIHRFSAQDIHETTLNG